MNSTHANSTLRYVEQVGFAQHQQSAPIVLPGGVPAKVPIPYTNFTVGSPGVPQWFSVSDVGSFDWTCEYSGLYHLSANPSGTIADPAHDLRFGFSMQVVSGVGDLLPISLINPVYALAGAQPAGSLATANWSATVYLKKGDVFNFIGISLNDAHDITLIEADPIRFFTSVVTVTKIA